MKPLLTRLASLNDLSAIAVLYDAYRQFYQQKPNLPLATEFIRQRLQRDESIIIVAEQAEVLLGFCQLYPSYCSVEAARIAILYDLYVRPEARKSGTGKALLIAAAAHASKNNFARLELSTAKTNLSAQSLYQTQGWIRDEIFFYYSKAV
jgi:ribosomal protein S18 acetylase RimI-like enzyme